MQKSYTVDGVSYNAETAKEIGKERFLLNFTDKKQGEKVWGILEKNLVADAEKEKKEKAEAESKEKNRKAAQEILEGKKTEAPKASSNGNAATT